MALLEARDLAKVYGAGTERECAALSGVSFRLGPGRIHGLLGPNGAGKTTLLRLLSTVARPTAGEILLDGAPLHAAPAAARARIGLLSSGTGLYERMTPRETLGYFGRLFGLPPADLPGRIDELARFLGFERLLDAKVEGLSDGERQRVNFGRMMIHDPEICLLDEPTENLDVIAERHIVDLVRHLRSQGKLILFSTHDLRLADRLCDDHLFLHHGRVLAQGTRAELAEFADSTDLESIFVALATAGDAAGAGDAAASAAEAAS